MNNTPRYKRVSRSSVPFLQSRRALDGAGLCSPAACWGMPRGFVHGEGFTINLHDGLRPWCAVQTMAPVAIISGTVSFGDVCCSYPLNQCDWWAFTVMTVHVLCGKCSFIPHHYQLQPSGLCLTASSGMPDFALGSPCWPWEMSPSAYFSFPACTVPIIFFLHFCWWFGQLQVHHIPYAGTL